MPRRDDPDPLSAAIGQRIRTLREARGWNLERVAFESGLASKGHLSDIEHGRVVPTVATLRTLAEHFGVEVLDLVTFPERGGRHQLIDRSREASTEQIARWLAELESSRSVAGSAAALDARPYGLDATRSPGARSGVRDGSLGVIRSVRAPFNCVGVVDLKHAPDGGEIRVLPDRWVKVDGVARSLPGAFVARVDDDAMAPRVPEGAVCLFRRPGPGNRRGRVFLVDLRGITPLQGSALGLRLLERVTSDRHRVTLRALSARIKPVTIDTRRTTIHVVAEFVRIVGAELTDVAE